MIVCVTRYVAIAKRLASDGWRTTSEKPRALRSSVLNTTGLHSEVDALFRAVRSEIASLAVVVDAKDENARRFYERESFLAFPDQLMKLFRPMADIDQLFK